MAERFKAAVLKTAVRESVPWVRIPLSPLRRALQIWEGARVVDWGCLLSSYTREGIAGSNPVLPV